MAILDQPPIPGTSHGILEQIRTALLDLTPAERRVAERILVNPEQAIALSISEFATLCNVAQPTVSRFCRNVGISNYAALRVGLTNDFAVKLTVTKPGTDQTERPAFVITGVTELVTLLDTLRTSMHIPSVIHTLRSAPHVEIWPSVDLSQAGVLLADQLTGLSVPAACAPVPARWETRARGLPSGSIIILLTSNIDDTTIASLTAAHKSDMQILCCTTHLIKRVTKLVDWLIPLPTTQPIDIVGLALVEVLISALWEISMVTGPEGPASPWRPWPYTRSVFLPTSADPIPAILLTHEDPPGPRPLILYFHGMNSSKENALPGNPENTNTICPRIIAALLNAGYHVLVVDTHGHGARKRAWEDPSTLLYDSFSGKGSDILAAIRAEAHYLVDGALALGITGNLTDANGNSPVAVVGQSWGGLQALLTMTGDPRISCGVGAMPVIHIPHLAPFASLEHAPRILAGEPGAWVGTHLAPRPLLLLAGERDEITPLHYVQQLLKEIRPAYSASSASEYLEGRFFSDLGHHFDPRLVDAAIEWLDRYLPDFA